jgi:drug/metabolite transporter (DMT)-like permease
MGVVASVGAIVGTLLPVIVAFFVDGIPEVVTMLGFGLAMAAVWLLSSGDDEMNIQLRDLGLPVLAGLGFGGFLVLIGQASETAVLWPLIAARAASLVTLSIVGMAFGQLQMPDVKQLPLIALVGLFDTGGNALYALAARAGRLDIAAVLGSLYTGGTVLLAWLILKERLARLQWVGVVTTLVAIALIAL